MKEYNNKKPFSYEEAIGYIHSNFWMGSRLGLERIEELLNLIDNPQQSLKFVHIAGTNGKGSVSTMLSSILTQSGKVTGLFTSPYILHFNERIKIDGEEIDNNSLAEITTFVSFYAAKMEDKPTEFELITAVAFEYFKRKSCDIVVLEVGLGGELDSTNIISAPELAVITALGLDHIDQLGSSMEEIAAAKAGIIKAGADVVFFGENKVAEDVIKAQCEKVGSSFSMPDFTNLNLHSADKNGLRFSYGKYKNIELSLCGTYQQKNTALVLTAVELLQKRGWDISIDTIYKGLKRANLNARFELLQERPNFIFDGGHNPHGIKGAIESFMLHFPDKKAVVVFGAMGDKDVKSILKLLSPLTEILFAINADKTSRTMPSKEIVSLAERYNINAIDAEDISVGVKKALEYAGEEKIVLALGSLYMYKDVLNAIKWKEK